MNSGLSILRGRLRATRRRAALAVGVAMGWVPAAAAQLPGDELPNASRARNEYLETTYGGVKQFLVEWQDGIRTADVKGMGKLFTVDGLYAPVEGYYVQGRAAIVDTLTTRLGRVRGYHASLIDFTASGGLAYYLGRMGYRLDDGQGGGRDVNGTFVMVLFQEGRRWRVRSYIERSSAFD